MKNHQVQTAYFRPLKLKNLQSADSTFHLPIIQVLHLAQLWIRGEGDLTRSHQLGLDVVQPGTGSNVARMWPKFPGIRHDLAMDGYG